MTDEELLQRMADGDQASFEALIHRYHAPLSGFLQRQLKDTGRAEDFVQETFLRLVRQLQDRKPPDNVQAWLYRVALNLCRDYWKSAHFRHIQASFAETPEQQDLSPSVASIAERQETRREIKESLDTLPEVQKEIIMLRFFQDLKLQDIADIVSLPLGSVKTHLYNGLRKLKSRLTPDTVSETRRTGGGRNERAQ
ncbi:RNA polymerase sigma-70 factor (ECF subfamily) [Paenibacillus phyllosphaerae]|uniref:RNA polymerase sigma-70 factor (ECF subfamily) n=1 Tax=Paenibacillus phyllosphaerae TaxID=274593 RepID=A0A7W5B4P5_9BACL|nr:RNA polymerase sigma factor [Paenibacillus phyllosphaerae]MBB3114375.1 RNA polymerase sigma-70 factor (ECF subfamily) [Paenibacillus phyllosphaerae]